MEDLQKEYNLSATYSQSADGADPGDEGYQFLRIKTDECGGGSYFVLETNRWAFDDPQELIDLINEFVKKNEKISEGKPK